ncbi:hypothetical protein SAMN05421863_1005138, partial [Nitrosomonas communis]
AIRQTEAKLREYGSHSVWISVATYVKCQQTLVKFQKYSNHTYYHFQKHHSKELRKL